jgi:hypothetical protein
MFVLASQDQAGKSPTDDGAGNNKIYGAKQPVHLPIDTIGEEEGGGAPVVAPNPEAECPKAAETKFHDQALRQHGAGLRNCSRNRSRCWVRARVWRSRAHFLSASSGSAATAPFLTPGR